MIHLSLKDYWKKQSKKLHKMAMLMQKTIEKLFSTMTYT